RLGAIAQLGERLLCKQEVVGSIPSGSTSLRRTAASAWQAALRTAKVARQGFSEGGLTEELVRENLIRACNASRPRAVCMRVLSDIVKRRSFRANVQRPQAGIRSARSYRHVCGDEPCNMLKSVKLDRLIVGSILK